MKNDTGVSPTVMRNLQWCGNPLDQRILKDNLRKKDKTLRKSSKKEKKSRVGRQGSPSCFLWLLLVRLSPEPVFGCHLQNMTCRLSFYDLI